MINRVTEKRFRIGGLYLIVISSEQVNLLPFQNYSLVVKVLEYLKSIVSYIYR